MTIANLAPCCAPCNLFKGVRSKRAMMKHAVALAERAAALLAEMRAAEGAAASGE